MTDKVQKIREVIEKRYEYWREKEHKSHSIESEIRMSECQHLLLMVNSLQEEPVSEDLEVVAQEHATKEGYLAGLHYNSMVRSFITGANWQKEQMMKDAIDTTIKQGCIELGILIKGLDKGKFSFGDKVKVIIIKSE